MGSTHFPRVGLSTENSQTYPVGQVSSLVQMIFETSGLRKQAARPTDAQAAMR
jgi:hypothetical protein